MAATGFTFAGNGGTVLEVDALRRVKTSPRHLRTIASFQNAFPTGSVGTLTAGEWLSFRNTSSNLVLIEGVDVSADISGTIAGILTFDMIAARAYTADGSGGTNNTLGTDGRMRTSMSTVTGVTCRVATSAVLTAGTRTLDSNPLAAFTTSQTTAYKSIRQTRLFGHEQDGMPLVLARNEGFLLRATTPGTVKFCATIRWDVIATY